MFQSIVGCVDGQEESLKMSRDKTGVIRTSTDNVRDATGRAL